jgi:hypothetical protein
VDTAWEAVRCAFETNFTKDLEAGAQLVVYVFTVFTFTSFGWLASPVHFGPVSKRCGLLSSATLACLCQDANLDGVATVLFKMSRRMMQAMH